jgi:hypothetical protein
VRPSGQELPLRPLNLDFCPSGVWAVLTLVLIAPLQNGGRHRRQLEEAGEQDVCLQLPGENWPPNTLHKMAPICSVWNMNTLSHNFAWTASSLGPHAVKPRCHTPAGWRELLPPDDELHQLEDGGSGAGPARPALLLRADRGASALRPAVRAKCSSCVLCVVQQCR